MPETVFPIPAQSVLLAGELHKRIVTRASSGGLKIYVVGGCLRDLVLHEINPQNKQKSKDLDYAIAGGSALAFAKQIASLLGGHFVALDEENDTARVVMPDGIILDFAGCLGGSIEQDILRRDFTINSLYMDPDREGAIVDLVGGIDDIKSGTIRALEPALFVSDPLRLLRAFRFAASWQFSIDAKTLSWIKSNAQLIATVAGERISAELFAIFALQSTEKIMPLLAETKLLEIIFPELVPTRTVTNNTYHHLNLFDHSLETAIQSEKEYAAAEIWPSTNLNEEISFAITRLAACKIACLLHDIGKPDTWIITEAGKHTFIGHDLLGAEMIAAIANRLRWSKLVERFISKLVLFHLRPGQLFHHRQPSKKAIARLFRKMDIDFPSLVLLALADLAATKGPLMTAEKSMSLRQNFYAILAEFYEFTAAVDSMEKFLDGNDVMRLLHLEPGEEIGKILAALREAQEFKEILNRSQAEDFVRSFHQKQQKKR